MKAEDGGMPPQHFADGGHPTRLRDDIAAQLRQQDMRLAPQVGDESGDVVLFCHSPSTH